MSEPSYFDDPRKAKKLRDEARSWIGTRFSQYYQTDELPEGFPEPDLKGPSGGIDCVGLNQEIFFRSGATEKFIFARVAADYQVNQSGDKILKWLRGEVDDPQSARLRAMFTELKIPDDVKDRDAETPRDFFKTGDLLVMQHGGLFHLPLIIDEDLHFVNAVPRAGVIDGTIQDSSYSIHLVAAFRLRP